MLTRENLYSHLEGSLRFEMWVKIVADPHAILRGFNLLDKEFKCLSFTPVEGEMKDWAGFTMKGKFWVVEASEVVRVIPQIQKLYPVLPTEPWFFPYEFCEQFPRPVGYLSKKIIDIKLR